jgi:hypothetical protein
VLYVYHYVCVLRANSLLTNNTPDLENSLREILEVASAWNTVVLLDEADIFLEKRTDSDVKHNAVAMVRVCLFKRVCCVCP